MRSTSPRDLSIPLVEWLRGRKKDPAIQWPYHPRSNDLLSFVREQVLTDLITSCPAAQRQAKQGEVAIDVNVKLEPKSSRVRGKNIDMVLGEPERALQPLAGTETLRKAKIGQPKLCLETKACMTAHLKAIPRLVDELASSLSVIRSTSEEALAMAIVCVNTSLRFTSPLNLPGPNRHKSGDADRVVREVLARIADDYDALAIVLIDFDNEAHIEIAAPDAVSEVPVRHHYVRALERVAALYTLRFGGG